MFFKLTEWCVISGCAKFLLSTLALSTPEFSIILCIEDRDVFVPTWYIKNLQLQAYDAARNLKMHLH